MTSLALRSPGTITVSDRQRQRRRQDGAFSGAESSYADHHHPCGGVGCRAVVAMLCALLCSCASYVSRLATMNDEREYLEALEDSREWLEDHADERGTPEWRKVYYQHARADLGVVSGVDSHEGYALFRRRHGNVDHVADLLETARRAEASAYYRGVVRSSDDVETYRAFRDRYPGTPAALQALRAEIVLAFEAAQARSSVHGYRSFRQRYEGEAEAEDALAEALQMEAELEYERIHTLPSTERWRTFRQRYGSFPALSDIVSRATAAEARLAYRSARYRNSVEALEAYIREYDSFPEASAQVRRARSEIVQVAFDRAVEAGTTDALVTFRETFTQDQWVNRANVAIGQLILRPLSEAVDGRHTLSHDDVDAIVDAQFEFAEELQQARLDPSVVHSPGSSIPRLRAFIALYPDATEREAAKRQMASALQTLFQQTTDIESPLRIVRHLPDESSASGIARGFGLINERERARRRGYTVTLRHQVTRASEAELTFTVDDCAGEPVVGLRPDAIRVFDGFTPLTIDSFLGMEDQRPLSVQIALDLSGSMQTEHLAVRQSIHAFVQSLAWRGREARIGLIGFSDRATVYGPLSDRPARFVRAMSRLPDDMVGGIEDGYGALMRASEGLARERAERAVVFLSDEHLQTGADGMRRLGAPARCVRLTRAAGCFSRCTTPQCQTSCMSRISPQHRRLMRRCRRRGARVGAYCAARALSQAMYALPACSLGDALIEPIATKLQSRSVRPFFVVGDTDVGYGATDSAYQQLADRLGGSVTSVPDETTDPAPYREALLGIADVLSRQYVASVSGAPAASASKPTILIRPGHEWGSYRARPALVDTAHVGGTPECPTLVAVRQGGELLRSIRCAQHFEPLGVQVGPGRLARAPDGRSAIATESNRVALVGSRDVEYFSVPNASTASHAAFDVDGRLWALASGRQQRAVAFSADGTLLVDWTLPARGTGFTMLPMRGLPEACVLAADGQRYCRRPGEGAWRTSAIRGLSQAQLVQLVRFDVGFPVTLAATEDGSVFRSVDRGRTFERVLQGSTAEPANIALSPRADLVCAGVGKSIHCSESDGLTWYAIGQETEDGTTPTPFFVGNHLYAIRSGRIDRAQRIVTRELPGASALFETNEDVPLRSANPLLQRVADVLTRDDALTMRIEGHADTRGDDADNDDLARRRAQNVKARIARMGVRRGRMTARSFGESRPLRTGNTAADHARNRRVEMIVLSPLPEDGWYGNRCP